MWSCLIPLVFLLCNDGKGQKLPLVLFTGHYAYRSFVFPFWLVQPKSTPLHVWLAACAFVLYNGLLQVMRMSQIASHFSHVLLIYLLSVLFEEVPFSSAAQFYDEPAACPGSS